MLLGYVGFISFFLITLLSIARKVSSRIVGGLSFVLILNMIVLRYYSGEVFDSYLVFLHGIIILMTALFILYLYRFKKLLGIIVLSIFMVGGISIVSSEASGSENGTYMRSEKIAAILAQRFPGKTFSVYDYKYMSPQVSLPVVLYLREQGLLSDTGQKIGITSYADAASMSAHPIIDPLLDVAVLRLSSQSGDLSEGGWGRVNASDVHRTTVLWYKNNENN